MFLNYIKFKNKPIRTNRKTQNNLKIKQAKIKINKFYHKSTTVRPLTDF
jgi:hypothetical protein